MQVALTPGAALSITATAPLLKDIYGRPQGESHTTFDVLPNGDLLLIDNLDTAEITAENPVVITEFNWLQNVARRLK
ncbi:MAG TPA: hypothetical protein VNJ02_00800 [Vicinamibacterales bacterium]|nr:hypothetical protein [Vicinamibacterales bacterium]